MFKLSMCELSLDQCKENLESKSDFFAQFAKKNCTISSANIFSTDIICTNTTLNNLLWTVHLIDSS